MAALEHEIVFRMRKSAPDREQYEERRAIAEAPQVEPIYSQSKRKEVPGRTRQMAHV